ncbi:MAG: GTPase HflX [Candidatus Helarchaeota archaeon]|nr:GTPase HflX [Candidatus Helarchaeota archaeon]
MKKRTVLCFLKIKVHDHWEFQLKIAELKRLVVSMDYQVVDTVIQQRIKKHSRYLMGKGKVEEIKEIVETYGVDTIIFYNVLTSKQNYNLTNELQCEVKDRYDLILEIFELQSSDIVSKKQITLAQMLKTFPKYKIQAHKKYRTEHAQFRSSGEFAYHSKIRAHDKRVAKIRKELEALKEKKLKEIASRKRGQFPFKTICISGYYNTGKTTLFNALTGAEKPVSDRPFTTLSSKYKHLKDRQSKIILIDTIGFVYDIDPTLINSFELQILDMQNAEKVLYLISLDDPLFDIIKKFHYGLELFHDIGVVKSRIIVVFNKIDLSTDEQIKKLLENLDNSLNEFPYTVISAKTSKNLNSLIKLF